MKIRHLLTMLALPLAGAVAVQAQSGSIAFQQGYANAFSGGNLYTGTSDVTLDSARPANNYGAATGVSFSSTQYAGLLRFDLTSFPDTVSAVENVKLRLAIRNVAANAGQSFTISLYQLNAANAGWVEGNKTGIGETAATAGEVAWGFKAKGAEGQPDTAWSSGGAFSTADYGSIAIGTYDYVSIASGTTYIEIDLPGSVIADWINNPSSNAGLVVRSSNNVAFSFYSSNYSAGFGPMLTFDYTLGPPVPESSTTALFAGAAALAAVLYMRRRKAVR